MDVDWVRREAEFGGERATAGQAALAARLGAEHIVAAVDARSLLDRVDDDRIRDYATGLDGVEVRSRE